MNQYQVLVSPRTRQQIRDYAMHIAQQSGSLTIAEQWTDRIFTGIERLEYFPRRFVRAEEHQHRDYDIYRQVIGNYLVLYTIDETAAAVRVIGFRHGARLPRPGELPADQFD